MNPCDKISNEHVYYFKTNKIQVQTKYLYSDTSKPSMTSYKFYEALKYWKIWLDTGFQTYKKLKNTTKLFLLQS